MDIIKPQPSEVANTVSRLAKNKTPQKQEALKTYLQSTVIEEESSLNEPSVSSQTISEPRTSHISENTSESNNKKNDLLEGRRIVEIQHFINQILSFPHHGLFACSSGTVGKTVNVVKEIRKGFISEFTLKCDLCKVEYKVTSDENDGKLNTNGAAVLGAISIGCGFSQLNEFISTINIPEISYKRYKAVEENLQEVIEQESWKCMLEAGMEEAEPDKITKLTRTILLWLQ
ncbi:hypothetical protein RN001_005769 [Aquatica leii]|uniref:Mutator-like transposase domain-containing protein n=1 Tax=Aquatica leii TaxID=1421715 RepID=A0AAN7SS46_9COLE|nr:hypothetical protein RN001_005769 [Aquatica leii]